MKKYKRVIVLIFLLTFTPLYPSASLAVPTSTNYSLPSEVLSEGGSEEASSSYKLIDCLGQPTPVASLESTSYSHGAGYVYTLEFAPPGAPTISNVSIVRTSDDPAIGKIKITWTVSPEASDCEVYTRTGPFSTDKSLWGTPEATVDASDPNPKSYTDETAEGRVGSGHQKYYKIVPKGYW